MLSDSDKQVIWRRAKRIRDRHNRNNLTRTNFYLEYWVRNPDIPWALLAHLVSRNAGWQMSDLGRFKGYTLGVPVVAAALRSVLGGIATAASRYLIDATYVVVETGNFLIFHDVVPQLVAFDLATTRYQADAETVFDVLADAEHGVELDPYMQSRWRDYAVQALSQSLTNEIKEEFALAQVVNEQFQLEARLFTDGDRYLSPVVSAAVNWVQDLAGMADLLHLCFPYEQPSPSHLYVYSVGAQFADLTTRVTTGRNLYAAIMRDPAAFQAISEWVRGHWGHYGTRVDYNDLAHDEWTPSFPKGYIDYGLIPLPTGWQMPSHALQHTDREPPWPENPGRTRRYRHIHQDPGKLRERLGSDWGVEGHMVRTFGENGPAILESWTQPTTAGPSGFSVQPLDQLNEIPEGRHDELAEALWEFATDLVS